MRLAWREFLLLVDLKTDRQTVPVEIFKEDAADLADELCQCKFDELLQTLIKLKE